MSTVKIYTRKGDKGETGLIGGKKVLKSALRVEAYGEVDELNAVLGWIGTKLTDETIRQECVQIQRDLFAVGAQLADPTGHVEQKAEKAGLHEERVRDLEGIIDRYDTVLSPLRAFTIRVADQRNGTEQIARA